MPTTRVLVVDDDAGIRELLGAALAFAGFETEAVGTVAGALTAMRERPPAILVLDVMLPDADGLEMLRLLRAAGDRTPVLFLSARDTVADRMAGFAVGGDDYVTKPFDLGEVVARIRAVLRRGEVGDAVPDAAADAPPDGDVLRYADLLVDTGRMTVSRAGRPLELSPTEFRLLALLASAPERVVSKAQLLDRLWSYDFGGDASVIEKVVSRLRRKLDPPDLPRARGDRALREPRRRCRGEGRRPRGRPGRRAPSRAPGCGPRGRRRGAPGPRGRRPLRPDRLVGGQRAGSGAPGSGGAAAAASGRRSCIASGAVLRRVLGVGPEPRIPRANASSTSPSASASAAACGGWGSAADPFRGGSVPASVTDPPQGVGPLDPGGRRAGAHVASKPPARTGGDVVKLIRVMLTSAIVAKAFRIARRELAKPENQRRIKELVNRATTRGSQLAKPRRAAA